MKEAQYSQLDLMDPCFRTACLIDKAQIHSGSPQEVQCAACGATTKVGTGVEKDPLWKSAVLEYTEDSVVSADLCPNCTELPPIIAAVRAVTVVPKTFDAVLKSINYRMAEGQSCVIHAFAPNGWAWYGVCIKSHLPGKRVYLRGPGQFYADFEIDDIVMQIILGDEHDAEFGMRAAIGMALGVCKVEVLECVSMTNITGDIYTGPIPLPAKVGLKIEKRLKAPSAGRH